MGNCNKKIFDREFFISVLDDMNANICITDIDTDKIIYMNNTMKKLFCLEHPEGSVCWQVLQPEASRRCSFCSIDKLKQMEADRTLVWNETNSITGRYHKNYDRILTWEGKDYFVRISADITELMRMTQIANMDELTKMPNRRYGKEKLGEVIEEASRKGVRVAIALCDVNELKKVNDQFGHKEGDRLLSRLSTVILQNLKARDFAFRLSGDEFVIVFYGSSREEAQQQIGRMKDKLIYDEISFSYGLLEIYPEDHYTVAEIISRADEQMYIQKRKYHILRAKEQLEKDSDAKGEIEKFEYDREHLYDALIDSTDDYIFVGNMRTGEFRYPPQMVEEFGLPGQVVENAAAFWGRLIHPHDQQYFLESNQEIADGRTQYHNIEYRAKNVKGEWIWLRCRGRMVCDEEGRPWMFAGMICNLGKKNQIDHMTGLYNKYEFEGNIKKSLVDSGMTRQLGVMVLNIDSFKNVNDLYNRSFGDEILRITAQKIASMLPQNAQIYRLDGDEFGVLILNGKVKGECRKIFSKIQRSFCRQQEYGGRKYYCTLSAGFASYPSDADNYLDLLKYANYSLEYSKFMGKNRLTMFSKGILQNKERSLELIEMLRESIERGFIGFSLNYQPQISTVTQELYGAEALARWHCEKYGNVSPGEFIPLLEQSGLIVQLGAWIFYQAAIQCWKWRKMKPDFHMSVNLSYRQLQEEDFLAYMQDTLEELHLPPSSITMELTETYLVQEEESVQETIKGIQAAGMSIAMDDFGKGYSSLFSLKNIPVNLVKIDREFVKEITVDLFNATFIRAITELCHDVGKTVCLEGVETEAEYFAVKDSGIELIQGFFFGRPVTAQQFEDRFFSHQPGQLP